jgi:hydroxymethylpyrimidine/phosphomethylpyrimidine kinase
MTEARGDNNSDDLEPEGPALVMSFNVGDPTGAGGLAADQLTLAAVGVHGLPVATGLLIRDSAEVFDHHCIDTDVVIEQARAVLEDGSIHAFKVGNLCCVETIGAVAEMLADYPELPVVTYVGNLGHLDDSNYDDYLSAIAELIVPQSHVVCGNRSILQEMFCPDWEDAEPPSLWHLAKACVDAGGKYLLVTGMGSTEGVIETVLLAPDETLLRDRVERFDAGFVGAGDTLSAALAGMLAAGSALAEAAAESVHFLDRSLEAGFRPGMGMVVPDRMFWAHGADPNAEGQDEPSGYPPSRLQ